MTMKKIIIHKDIADVDTRLDELGVQNSLQSMPGGRHMGFTDDQFQKAWREIFG